MIAAFFFQYAAKNPVYFASVIFTVVVSVVLHELGHAVAAIRQGDETPRYAGHLTLDPLVHMGGMSLAFLFLAGIAWGQTPVDPTRFRSRHGDALVSAAGPAVNLGLALLGTAALWIWIRSTGVATEGAPKNLQFFLLIFATWNVVLLLLNLIPIPPLDGSHVVASFVPTYGTWARNPSNQGLFLGLFILVFMFGGELFDLAFDATLFLVPEARALLAAV